MYNKSFLVVAVLLMACSISKGQQVISGFEFGEIRNISEAYYQAPSLSFNMQFSYADSARQDSILEQIPASYKMQNGKYRAMIDSTEIVQGNSYNISIFYYDSVISVSNPQKYSNIMQLPFLDSLFRAQNVDSMKVTQVNDSTRKLYMYFRHSSYYRGFTISYDQNTYLLHSITYFIKRLVNEDNPEGGTNMINVIFSNYSTKVIDDSYFREDKFIYKQGNQFFAQHPYENYQLMVNVH